MRRKWEDYEIKFVKDNCDILSAREISIRLNRSIDSTKHKIRLFKTITNNKHTKEFLNLLISLSNMDQMIDFSIKFNISIATIIRFRAEHKIKNPRIYKIWCGIKARCYNPKEPAYKNYGARGIVMCDAWKNDFVKFYEWAKNNGYDDSLTIDRIDNSGNYCSENCRWATRKVQCNNKRSNKLITAWGETKTISQWSDDERCSVSQNVLSIRLRCDNRTNEEIISLPNNMPKKTTIYLTAFGETKSIKDWLNDSRCSVEYSTLFYRIKYSTNYTPEEMISLPPDSSRRTNDT